MKLLGVGFGVFLVILWIYTLLKSGFGPSFNLALVFSLGLFFLTKRYGTRLLRAKEGKLQPDFNDSRLYFIAGRALKLFTLSMISSYAAMLVVSVFSS